MSGAEPWTGSKIPRPCAQAGRGSEAEPAITAPASSERMSPNMFSVTMTSNCAASVTSASRSVDQLVLERDVGVLGGHLGHVRRHSRDVSSTLALSTEVTWRRRARASSNAAARSAHLARVVLERVEYGAVGARPLRPP